MLQKYFERHLKTLSISELCGLLPFDTVRTARETTHLTVLRTRGKMFSSRCLATAGGYRLCPLIGDRPDKNN
jgi:hypothetical protein